MKKRNHFTIIIPSYNNEKWVKRNLSILFAQDYPWFLFDIVYIDDASTDSTSVEVEKYIDSLSEISFFGLRPNRPNFTHIVRERNLKALDNLYQEIHKAKDNTIIVTLDGDDWLASKNVLRTLNDVYNEKDVWMTAGSYLATDTKNIVHSSYPKTRLDQWSVSHLRTFRKELFCSIKKEDLLDHDGEFYKFTFDQAMMYPMCEMAGPDRFASVEDVLLIYNRDNPLAVDKIHRSEQLRIERRIRQQKPYQKKETL